MARSQTAQRSSTVAPKTSDINPNIIITIITIKLSEVKPWCVGAGNEEVDHGTVAAVQQVPPDAVPNNWCEKVYGRFISFDLHLLSLIAATVWKTVETVNNPVSTAPYTQAALEDKTKFLPNCDCSSYSSHQFTSASFNTTVE